MTLQCDICGGTGKNPRNPSDYCRACECQVFSRKEVDANRKRFGESKMTEHCERCQGSGEDPEGFLEHGGPDAVTHQGPCRQCLGSGEPCKPLAKQLVISTPTGRSGFDEWYCDAGWLTKRRPNEKFCIGCCGWVQPNPDNSLPCGH